LGIVVWHMGLPKLGINTLVGSGLLPAIRLDQQRIAATITSRAASTLLDDLDHGVGLRIDDDAPIVDDGVSVSGIFGDRYQHDFARRAERVVTSGVAVVGLSTALALAPDLPTAWLNAEETAPKPTRRFASDWSFSRRSS